MATRRAATASDRNMAPGLHRNGRAASGVDNGSAFGRDGPVTTWLPAPRQCDAGGMSKARAEPRVLGPTAMVDSHPHHVVLLVGRGPRFGGPRQTGEPVTTWLPVVRSGMVPDQKGEL
jgi:hypothetical protein